MDIPATDAEDEIGAMARTVIVFRDNAVEREQLAVTQEKSVRERERRTETIAATIARFEDTVDEALAQGARRRANGSRPPPTRSTARPMRCRRNPHRPRSASAPPRMNVTSAASSAEELAASIGEIAGQAATSTEVASRAVTEAQRTVADHDAARIAPRPASAR